MMRHWFNLLHAGCRTATSVTRAQRSLLNPSEVTTTQRGFAVFKGNLSASNDTGTPAKEEAVEEEPLVLIDRVEHLRIMTIGINRPKKRNCVNEETANKLREAFEAFEADEEAYCAVLHGIGGNFCAGYDLEQLASLDEDQLRALIAVNMLESGPMGPTRMTFSKPVIAAMEGWCVGGGLELALMCDLRIMDETAQLGFLNRRFGVPLLDGGSVRLPHLIGMSRALDLILTGRIIGGEEALQFGLVNRLAKPGTAFGRAMHLAKEIIFHPQQCLKVDRESAYHAMYSSKNLDKALQFEGDHALGVISVESVQGARKFASGLGRHGKFNVNPVAEKQDWQKELDKIKENDANQK